MCRHVTLPRQQAQDLCKVYKDRIAVAPILEKLFRGELLEENEWREIGIQQRYCAWVPSNCLQSNGVSYLQLGLGSLLQSSTGAAHLAVPSIAAAACPSTNVRKVKFVQ